MTGTTRCGAEVHVYVSEDEPMVMFGISAPRSRKWSAYPITPKEARNLARWLNGAADDAESVTVPDAAQPQKDNK